MSNEKQHTPEPWAIETDLTSPQARKAIVSESGYHVASCYGNLFSSEQAKANAARIVACVNACKGIQKPEQYMSEINETFGRLYAFAQGEGSHLFKLGESISKRSIELIKQRDELLAALELAADICDIHRKNRIYGDNPNHWTNTVLNAINNAKPKTDESTN